MESSEFDRRIARFLVCASLVDAAGMVGEPAMRSFPWFCLALLAFLTLLTGTLGRGQADPPVPDAAAAERGREALLGRTWIPATLRIADYDNAWKNWGLKQAPKAEDYPRLLRERYGLHAAPFANDGFPMGLTQADDSGSEEPGVHLSAVSRRQHRRTFLHRAGQQHDRFPGSFRRGSAARAGIRRRLLSPSARCAAPRRRRRRPSS